MKRYKAQASEGKSVMGPKKGCHRWIYRGLTKDAKSLGVSRILLYLVITGRRKNSELLERYRQLKAAQLEAQNQTTHQPTP